MALRNYSPALLNEFLTRVFAVFLPNDHAQLVTRSLIAANLRDVNSHGLLRVPVYLDRLRRGLVNVRPRLEFSYHRAGLVTLNADNAMGAIAASTAATEAARLAGDHGVSTVAVCNSNHFGMASHYVEPLARDGFVAICMSNSTPTMAVWGSRIAGLGTNPIAVAIPAKPDPIVFDMASSIVARGRIMQACDNNLPIDPRWALDRQGRPTTSAQEALEGTILPAGGHKGAGLALIAEVLSAGLAGGDIGVAVRSLHDFSGPQQTCHWFLALNVSAFLPLSEFAAKVDGLVRGLKSLPRQDAVDTILMPGERAAACARERQRLGIPLDDSTIRALRTCAQSVGLSDFRALDPIR